MVEPLENEIQLKNIINEEIINEKTLASGVRFDILRLDLIHSVVSGNKYFKLKYYLNEAISWNSAGILSFGGPWSNHIVAVAYTAFTSGLKSVGIIRGQKPGVLSNTLLRAASYGMEFHFFSRAEYANKDEANWLENIRAIYPDFYIIAEGGYGTPGARGAADILEHIKRKEYSHICCACGTGTMMAGLINGIEARQMCIGISVLKGDSFQMETRVKNLLHASSTTKNFNIQNKFHFGGYAKADQNLFNYMNDFYHRYGIPTDFVYTGKLMYAIEKLIAEGFFEPGSSILAIHSGGLQGNLSLKPGTLAF